MHTQEYSLQSINLIEDIDQELDQIGIKSVRKIQMIARDGIDSDCKGDPPRCRDIDCSVENY